MKRGSPVIDPDWAGTLPRMTQFRAVSQEAGAGCRFQYLNLCLLSQSTVNLRPSVRPLVYPINCGFSKNWKSWGSLCGSVCGHVSLHACFTQCKARSGKKRSSLFNSSHTRSSVSIGVHSAHIPTPTPIPSCALYLLLQPSCQPVFPALL